MGLKGSGLKGNHNRFIISLFAPNQIDILKGIASVIADMNGNIDGISQRIIHGYFTIVLTVTFSEPVETHLLRESLSQLQNNGALSVTVYKYQTVPTSETTMDGDNYVLTLFGKDRPGILKMVTSFLVENNITIEVYYFKIEGELVTHVAEVIVPPKMDIKKIKGGLHKAVSKIGLTADLQHENIFLATNEVRAVKFFLRG